MFELSRAVPAVSKRSSTLARGEPAKEGDPTCAVRLVPPDASGDWRKVPNTEVTFDPVDSHVRIRKATRKSKRLSRGDEVLAHLRSIRPSNKLTTNEIMCLMRGKP